MISLGIDLALRSTGWATWGGPWGRIRTDLVAHKGLTAIHRRRYIAHHVAMLVEGTYAGAQAGLDAQGVDLGPRGVLVVMERSWVGPAASALLPLHGVVVDAIERTGASLVHVSPQALKRHACGKAGAKAEMIPAAQAAGYPGRQPDEADAWMLALIGHHLLGGTDYASPHRSSCLAAVETEIPLPERPTP